MIREEWSKEEISVKRDVKEEWKELWEKLLCNAKEV